MTQENTHQNISALYFYENIRWRFLSNTLWGGLLLVILVIVVLGGGIPGDRFWAAANLKNLMWSWLTLALLAPTMVLIVASGGFDLSVGAVVGLTTVTIASLLASANVSLGVAVMAGLGLALAVGLVNGFLIGMVRLNAVMVTLGMMTMLRGIAYIIAEGKVISAREVGFLSSLIIPGIVLILLVIVCIAAIELKLIASKRQATPDSKRGWIRQSLSLGLPYVLSSIMAGLVGILYLNRLRSGIPEVGAGLEVDIILIVFLGGTPFGSGLANIIGAVLAALIIAITQNIAVSIGIFSVGLNIGKGAGLLIFGLLCHVYYYLVNLIFIKNKKKAIAQETDPSSASSLLDEGS